MSSDADDPRVAPAPHRLPVPGGRWLAWRRVGVRGAGFPVVEVLAMAAPEAAAEADRLLDQGAEVEGNVEFEETWSRELDRIHAAGRRIAMDPAFREAITWQNRPVLHHTLDPFVRKPEARGWKARQRLATIARYLQRYCTKNETIGFFGPVGWATIVDDGPPVAVRIGQALVCRRRVAFEQWAIDEVARALAARFDVRPWTKPRLHPFFHVENDRLLIPGQLPVPLPPQHIALLKACDGTRTARDLAMMAIDQGAPGIQTEDDAFGLLGQIAGLGVLAWTLEVPLSAEPELSLRAQLDEIGDDAIREPALGALDGLIAAKEAVAAAAGDAAALDEAMQRLEEEFTTVSGAAPSRKAGALSAGRTLVSEDCVRDAEVTFGPALLERIGPALSLVLDARRWLSWQIAQHYLPAITALYDAMAKEKGTPQLELTELYQAFALQYIGEGGAAVAAKAAELRGIVEGYERRWSELFPATPGTHLVERRSAEIAERARSAFDAPACGWPGMYFTPNLLVAARGAEAFARGEFTVVLGKVQPGNFLTKAALAEQHPDPAALVRELTADHPRPHVAPMPVRDFGPRRTSFTVKSASTYWLHFSPDPPSCPPERRLPVADLVAYREDQSVRVKARDGKVDFEVVEVLAAWFAEVVHATSFILPEEEHRPRRVIDSLVVERECWTFAASDVELAHQKTTLSTFIAARRLARRLGWPRYLYVKVDGEPKPIFVDIDSPIYVDMLARVVRVAAKGTPGARVRFTEMLPTVEELWLTDHAGRPCTSELVVITHEPER